MKTTTTSIRRHAILDGAFKLLAATCAAIALAIIAGIFIELVRNSHLAIREYGFGFLFSKTWDPNPLNLTFGALPSIFGTVVSTLIAMTIAVPMSVVIALFLVELSHPYVSRVVGYAIELLAAIPSIIFGMWGLFVFAPFMADHVQGPLGKYLGLLPLFQGPPMGIGIMTAGIILALMVLPFITAVMRDVFLMVSPLLKEAGHGIGATTCEVTSHVVIPYGIRGLVGAIFLGLGRALGETMAVTFVIGNAHHISPSLFEQGTSIASTLANEFTEATEPLYKHTLMELGLILFVITLVIQVIAQLWLKRLHKSMGEKV